MADKLVVVNDALCFITAKFGKTALKVLKSTVVDFYDTDGIAAAKQQLIRDIDAMDMTSSRPHVYNRRDGDNRLAHEVDDIILLLTFVDEQKAASSLPRYVSTNPEFMPSIRLYEGELSSIMSYLHGMDNRLKLMESTLAAISSDVHKLEVWPSLPESTTRQQPTTLRSAGSTAAPCNKQSRQAANRPSVSATAAVNAEIPMSQVSIAAESANHTASMNKNLLLDDTMLLRNVRWEDDVNSSESMLCDDDMEGQWESETPAMRKRRLRKRRRRNKSEEGARIEANALRFHDSTDIGATAATRDYADNVEVRAAFQQATGNVNSESARQGYAAVVSGSGVPQQRRNNRKRMLIGKRCDDVSNGSGNITAAKPYVGKAVFCIDNVMTSATEENIRLHVRSIGVDVLSCHQVQPRRSRWQRANGVVPVDRSTFRLCIPREQSSKLLIADAWPSNITISAWRFARKQDTMTMDDDIENSRGLHDEQQRQSTSDVSCATTSHQTLATVPVTTVAAASAVSSLCVDGKICVSHSVNERDVNVLSGQHVIADDDIPVDMDETIIDC